MSQEPILPDELKEIELALAALVPRAARLDRDRLMFLAGQAAAGRPALAGGDPPAVAPASWGWPLATGLSTTLSVALVVALVLRGPAPVEVRYVERPANEIASVNDDANAVGDVAIDDAAINDAANDRATDGAPGGLAATGRNEPYRANSSPLRFGPEAGYFFVREVALRYGIDVALRPSSSGGAASSPTSGQLMRELLLESAPAARSPDSIPIQPPTGSGGASYETGVPS